MIELCELWSLLKRKNSLSFIAIRTGTTDFQMLNGSVSPEMDHNLGFWMVNHMIDEDFAYPRDHLTRHAHLGFTTNCDGLGVKRWRGCGKRSKTASLEEQSHPQPQHTTKLPLPTSRSQKLGDKITVLQKLVSPYGKTNTAAVLEEARLYIELLQQQIETLSSSFNTNTETQSQADDERPADLRSRGLCLVPVSFSRKVTANKDPTDFLEKIKVPRNFN